VVGSATENVLPASPDVASRMAIPPGKSGTPVVPGIVPLGEIPGSVNDADVAVGDGPAYAPRSA
jgi:hypothetical protein